MNQKLIERKIVTVTKEDYFFDEFGKVKSKVGSRFIELDGSVLIADNEDQYPQVQGVKTGDKILKQVFMTEDNGLRTSYIPMSEEQA